jgi:hypothetical protein
MKNKEKEYERLSSEILQDQQIRITIFTFSITTTAAIIGFSSQMIPSSGGSESGILSIIVFAIYAILIPSIILVNHYSRGINLKSEYLRKYHFEDWMKEFDKLTEETIPSSLELSLTHRVLVKFGGYSTENAFRIAYLLLSILVTVFAIFKTDSNQFVFFILYLAFFLIILIVMRIFRPIRKHEYRILWERQWEREQEENTQSDRDKNL